MTKTQHTPSFFFPKRHLLTCEGLTAKEINSLLDLADQAAEVNRQVNKKRDVLRGRTLINLFSRRRRERRARSNWPASVSAPTS